MVSRFAAAAAAFFTVLFLCCCGGVDARTKYVLNFDIQTFDKVIGPGRRAVVKFDTEYPHGPTQDAWIDFAAFVASSARVDEQRPWNSDNQRGATPSTMRVFVGEVRLKDSAPDDANPNLMLLARHNISRSELPVIIYIEMLNGAAPRYARYDAVRAGRVTGFDIARWASLTSGVLFNFPHFAHPDLDAVHDATNAVFDAILQGSPGGPLQSAYIKLIRAVDTVRHAHRRSAAHGEASYQRALIDRVFKAVERETRGAVGDASGVATRDLALLAQRAIAEQEDSIRELFISQTHAQIISSLEGKLVIIHLLRFRLEWRRANLPRYKLRSEPSRELEQPSPGDDDLSSQAP